LSAADQLTGLLGGITRLVRDSPPERIERLMRTPARRVVLDGIFWQIPQHLNRRRIGILRSTVRLLVTGRPDGDADTYQIEFEDGRCRVVRGTGESEPSLTITVDGAELVLIAAGRSDPMRAFFRGRLALAGDVVLAAKLVAMLAVAART
jgi:predicted lipid carrier protein YhbT